MSERRRKILARLPDLITLVVVPPLWLALDTSQAQLYFEKYNLVTLITLAIAFFAALMVIVNPGFALLSHWCALVAGLLAFSGLDASMRVLEAPIPALYLVLQTFIPRMLSGLSEEASDAPPLTVSASSNFSHVYHAEPAKPLAKEDLWKRPLYTAERVRNNWSLRLAERPYPPITLTLIALSVFVFVAGWHFAPSDLRRVTALWQGLYPLAAPESLAPGLLRALSAATLHWSVAQLAANTILVVWLGRVLEPTLGRRRFAAYILAGGVVAAIAGAFWPGSVQIGTGASGAVYALIGVYLAIVAIHFRNLDLYGKQRALGLLPVGILVITSIGTSSFSEFAPVNHIATISGVLTGFMLVLAFGPHFVSEADLADPNVLTVRTRHLLRRAQLVMR